MEKNTIVSINVSRNERDKEKLKEQQNKQMQLRQVEQGSGNYKHTQSAFADKHMIEALKQVQQSDTTIDASYSRFQGSSYYTETIGQSLKKVERNALRKIKKALPKKQSKDVITTTEPVKKSKSIKQPIQETLWQKVCRQIDKPRFGGNTLFENTNRYGVNVRAQQQRKST